MPDLKLAPLLEATHPQQLQPLLEPFGRPDGETGTLVLESTRLQPPLCYWATYRRGPLRLTLKSFFSTDDYERYTAQLAAYYPDRLDQPGHPRGGLLLLPELNGIVWAFPFDPVMPGLSSCLDAARIADILRRRSEEPLVPEVVSYTPEIGALIAWRKPVRARRAGRVIAYGKYAPDETCGRIFVVMDRLWHSPARESGYLRLARPLAFRPEAGLLLQAPVAGKSIVSDRNQPVFMDLVEDAGPALAAIHAADVPFGEVRRLHGLLARLHGGLEDLALTAPPLHVTLRQLLAQIEARARREYVEVMVPSHGDYKWDQFLEYRRRFSLIDFELFCQAEREFDIGYFCAYLPSSAPRDWQESAAAEMLRAAFLRGYTEAAGEPPDMARVGLYEAAMLAIRALSYSWTQQAGWEMQAGPLLDLAFERLANPNPDS